jgi:hypothetical protein
VRSLHLTRTFLPSHLHPPPATPDPFSETFPPHSRLLDCPRALLRIFARTEFVIAPPPLLSDRSAFDALCVDPPRPFDFDAGAGVGSGIGTASATDDVPASESASASVETSFEPPSPMRHSQSAAALHRRSATKTPGGRNHLRASASSLSLSSSSSSSSLQLPSSSLAQAFDASWQRVAFVFARFTPTELIMWLPSKAVIRRLILDAAHQQPPVSSALTPATVAAPASSPLKSTGANSNALMQPPQTLSQRHRHSSDAQQQQARAADSPLRRADADRHDDGDANNAVDDADDDDSDDDTDDGGLVAPQLRILSVRDHLGIRVSSSPTTSPPPAAASAAAHGSPHQQRQPHTTLPFFYKVVAIVGHRYCAIDDAAVEFAPNIVLAQPFPDEANAVLVAASFLSQSSSGTSSGRMGAQSSPLHAAAGRPSAAAVAAAARRVRRFLRHAQFLFASADLARSESFAHSAPLAKCPRALLRLAVRGDARFVAAGAGTYLFDQFAAVEVLNWTSQNALLNPLALEGTAGPLPWFY